LVGRPLEIALISLYRLIAWSIGIKPAIARSSLKENRKTLISACQKKYFPAQIP